MSFMDLFRSKRDTAGETNTPPSQNGTDALVLQSLAAAVHEQTRVLFDIRAELRMIANLAAARACLDVDLANPKVNDSKAMAEYEMVATTILHMRSAEDREP